MQCHNKRSYAGASVRIAAYIIDSIVALMVCGMVAIFLSILKAVGLKELLEDKILFSYTIAAIIYFVVKVLYFVILTSATGQTVGKRLFRIKVLNEDMKKASVWQVIYREFIGRYLSKVFCYIGYFILLLDDKKQGLHDRLSDTVVVYEDSLNNEMKVDYSYERNMPIKEVSKDNNENKDMELADTENGDVTTEQEVDFELINEDVQELNSVLEEVSVATDVNDIDDMGVSEIDENDMIQNDTAVVDDIQESIIADEEKVDELIKETEDVEAYIDSMAADISNNIESSINEDEL